MRIRSLLTLSCLVLLFGASASGQRNHKPNWQSGASPNVFDTVEKKADDSKEPPAAEAAAQRQHREAKVSELNLELEDIIRTASELQECLKAADPNNVVSVDLRTQGKQLEEAARKIRKQISSL